MAPLPLNTRTDIWRNNLLVPRQNDASPLQYTPPDFGNWRKNAAQEGIVVESWGEGFMFGALLIMAFITIANMRKRVLLHKLILLELLLAMSHGTFCFMDFKGYGWYLSSTASLLYSSYFVHNVVAWMKIAPFFVGRSPSFSPKTGKWVRIVYLSTLMLTIGPLVFQIYNNFRFFNDIATEYKDVRPYEPLFRDPWWVFSDIVFIHVIRKVYNLRVIKLVKKSPRFGILLLAIALAIIFTIMDILSSIIPALIGTDGINPYWKLALVFKCLTDNIMLDDFKSVLQRLGALKLDGDDSGKRTAIGFNALNLEPDEKAGTTDDDAVRRTSGQSQLERWKTRMQRDRANRMSFSGRLLDDGESIDEDGYTRNRQGSVIGRTNSQLGKVGIKIRKLPRLPMFMSSKKREEQKQREWEEQANAELNKHVGAADVQDTQERDFALENELQPVKSTSKSTGKSSDDQDSSADYPFAISALGMQDGPRDTGTEWPSAISPLNLPDGPQEIGILDEVLPELSKARERPGILRRPENKVQDLDQMASKPQDISLFASKMQSKNLAKDKAGNAGKPESKEPWDDMDFITALTDPAIERQAPDER